MADSQVRLLRLIGQIQRRPGVLGRELALELGVTDRTLRRDVARLRRSGYLVLARPGRGGGGYRLGGSASLPPLPLDDAEVRAVAVALGVSPGRGPADIEGPPASSLAKLDTLLPARLRQQVAALRQATVSLDRGPARVPTERLVALAEACQQHQRIRFRYPNRDGGSSLRQVEPHRLVATDEHWYLLCHDQDRRDWRTFRVDRISELQRVGGSFVPRDLDDPAGMVARAVALAPYRFRVVVEVEAPAERISALVPPSACLVQPTLQGCLLTLGANRLAWVASFLVDLEHPFLVREPEELRRYLRALGSRLVETNSGPRRRPADPRPSPATDPALPSSRLR